MDNQYVEEITEAELFARAQLIRARDEYFNNCNDSYLASLVRNGVDSQGYELAQPTRDFIADVLEGNIKRTPGRKKNNWLRDHTIALEIYKLVDIKKSHNLTSGRCDGAAAIIGNKYGIEEESTAIKIYQRNKARIENDIQENRKAMALFKEHDQRAVVNGNMDTNSD
jgi:hypothetical protein